MIFQGSEAGKTGEWEGGIGKLAQPLEGEAEALIAPYRDIIRTLNGGSGMTVYPGSPELALRLMRAEDRLIANELHPMDAVTLERHFIHDARVDVSSMDAEMCLKTKLPPPERRGLVLIDPPYEIKDEAQKTVRMLQQGLRRFATGIFAVWYPVKGRPGGRECDCGCYGAAVPATLKVELRIREFFVGGGLAGSGLVILNTPWMLDKELSAVVPALARRLGLGDWGRATVEWLVPPV